MLKGVIEENGHPARPMDSWPHLQRPLGNRQGGAAPSGASLLRRAIAPILRGSRRLGRRYPGIHAVTLMELQDKRDERQRRSRRSCATRHAKVAEDSRLLGLRTLMELAVHRRDDAEAQTQLSEALGVARASWELESTAKNLERIATRGPRARTRLRSSASSRSCWQAAEDMAAP